LQEMQMFCFNVRTKQKMSDNNSGNVSSAEQLQRQTNTVWPKNWMIWVLSLTRFII
jgi:hypothetical protein